MRIIAGRLGGRQFDAPKGFKTHPMSDKARGALFNMLGDLEGLSVLDAFAGSGALSFEAISRGATHATAIEQDRQAQHIIAGNIKTLGVEDRVKLISASANAWLQTNPNAVFDLVLCDPPYNDLQQNLLKKLAARVADHGLMLVSWPSDTGSAAFDQFTTLEQRHHGDLSLIFYRRTGDNTGEIR